MKKKIIAIVVIVLVVLGIGLSMYLNRFKYNDNDVVGNTSGNLNTGGLFCENDGYIYFANPYDNNKLYKMDLDAKKAEKVCDDIVSYINVAGDYIYYARFNNKDAVETIFKGNLYGIFRLKKGSDKGEPIHTGVSTNIALTGNYIYYQGYNDKKVFELRKVKIDGKEDKKISDTAYSPVSISNGNVYFPEEAGNHNLMKLDTQSDNITVHKLGNFYLPVVLNNYLYYIDLDNSRRLTKMNLSTEKTQVLTEDSCVSYNISEDKNVIFYQAENSVDDHKLVKIDTNGDNLTVIKEGDCYNISITSKYMFYIEKIGKEEYLYKVSIAGASVPQPVSFN